MSARIQNVTRAADFATVCTIECRSANAQLCVHLEQCTRLGWAGKLSGHPVGPDVRKADTNIGRSVGFRTLEGPMASA